MQLPGRQDDLISAIAAVNPNTVVVVNAGSPVTMPWRNEVSAIFTLWFPGGALGDALCDVVFGETDPGGRLPLTFPVSLNDLGFPHYPGVDGVMRYGEGRQSDIGGIERHLLHLSSGLVCGLSYLIQG